MRTQLADRALDWRRRASAARSWPRLDRAGASRKSAGSSLSDLEKQGDALTSKLATAESELAKLEQERQMNALALASAQEAERKAAEQLNSAQRALGGCKINRKCSRAPR